MPTNEDIVNQQTLLKTRRRTLQFLLSQRAMHTYAFTPTAILHGIDESDYRTEIMYGIDYSKIELFCLGAGFVRNIYYNSVEISYREEKIKDQTMTKSKQVDVVCDILALPDIIPSKSDIENIKVELNKKWNEYSSEIINSIRVADDVYDTLALFIKSSLYQTAAIKLRGSLKFRTLIALQQLKLSTVKPLSRWKDHLDKNTMAQAVLIEKVSTDESVRQVKKVASKSGEIVASRKEDFSSYITLTLNDFLSDQSIIILDLLMVGRNHTLVLNHFNQAQFYMLSQKVYTHLKAEVDKEIENYWKFTLARPRLEQAKIGAKLNIVHLQRLVENCMKRDIWSELRPFVEEIIQNLFESIFVAQVRERIPYWIGLASSREVIKPISKISQLIPVTTDIDLYSEEYMYGIAPIKEALDRCAIRFTSKDHSRKNKTLILFTDGEFENANPLFDPLRVADVIKKSGVRILCFYVGNRDITKKGSTALIKNAPRGATIMYDMSSDFDPEEPLEKGMIKRGLTLPQSKKLFFQINKVDTLREVLQVLLVDSYELEHGSQLRDTV